MIVSQVGNKFRSLVSAPFSDSTDMTNTHNSFAEERLLANFNSNQARHCTKDLNHSFGNLHPSVVFLSDKQERCDPPVAFDHKVPVSFMFMWNYNNSLDLQKPVCHN